MGVVSKLACDFFFSFKIFYYLEAVPKCFVVSYTTYQAQRDKTYTCPLHNTLIFVHRG